MPLISLTYGREDATAAEQVAGALRMRGVTVREEPLGERGDLGIDRADGLAARSRGADALAVIASDADDSFAQAQRALRIALIYGKPLSLARLDPEVDFEALSRAPETRSGTPFARRESDAAARMQDVTDLWSRAAKDEDDAPMIGPRAVSPAAVARFVDATMAAASENAGAARAAQADLAAGGVLAWDQVEPEALLERWRSVEPGDDPAALESFLADHSDDPYFAMRAAERLNAVRNDRARRRAAFGFHGAMAGLLVVGLLGTTAMICAFGACDVGGEFTEPRGGFAAGPSGGAGGVARASLLGSGDGDADAAAPTGVAAAAAQTARSATEARFRRALAAAEAERDQLRDKVTAAERARAEAARRLDDLQEERDRLRATLEATRSERDRFEAAARDRATERDAMARRLREGEAGGADAARRAARNAASGAAAAEAEIARLSAALRRQEQDQARKLAELEAELRRRDQRIAALEQAQSAVGASAAASGSAARSSPSSVAALAVAAPAIPGSTPNTAPDTAPLPRIAPRVGYVNAPRVAPRSAAQRNAPSTERRVPRRSVTAQRRLATASTRRSAPRLQQPRLRRSGPLIDPARAAEPAATRLVLQEIRREMALAPGVPATQLSPNGVRLVQRCLRRATGAPLRVDGVWGRRTTAALMAVRVGQSERAASCLRNRLRRV